MVEINLLPAEKKPKTSVIRLARSLKKILTILVVVFIVTTAVTIVVFLFFANRVKVAQDEYSEIKRQVAALEQTEQRFFLLKDRLGKIEKIRETDTIAEEVGVLSDVLDYIEGQAVFAKAELGEDEAKVTVKHESSKNLANVIESLVNDGDYEVLQIVLLDYSPSKGYETEFLLKAK